MSTATGSRLLTRCLIAAADAVAAAADELNRLDGKAGDGDLGVTMTAAAATLRAAVDDGAESADARALLARIGGDLARTVPSTSGTLVATGFLRAARAIADGPEQPLAAGLAAATAGIRQRGKAEIGDKTMVDALVPASTALDNACKAGATAAAALAAAAAAASAATERTAELVAQAGRASWMAERSRGHPDGGCRMVTIALDAAARSAAEAA